MFYLSTTFEITSICFGTEARLFVIQPSDSTILDRDSIEIDNFPIYKISNKLTLLYSNETETYKKYCH